MRRVRPAGVVGPLQALLVVVVSVAAAQPARADCEDDLKVLAPQVQAIGDAATKRRADRYLVRALRELDEGDELDCQPAADAVREFLNRSRTATRAGSDQGGPSDAARDGLPPPVPPPSVPQ